MDNQDAMAGTKAQLQKQKSFSMHSCIEQPYCKWKTKSDAKAGGLDQIIII